MEYIDMLADRALEINRSYDVSGPSFIESYIVETSYPIEKINDIVQVTMISTRIETGLFKRDKHGLQIILGEDGTLVTDPSFEPGRRDQDRQARNTLQKIHQTLQQSYDQFTERQQDQKYSELKVENDRKDSSKLVNRQIS